MEAFRLHHMHGIDAAYCHTRLDVAWSACLSITTGSRAERLNRSRCHLESRLGGPEKLFTEGVCILAPLANTIE